MASSSRNLAIALFFFIVGHAFAAEMAEDEMYSNLAGIDKNSFGCEELPVQHCAFAVSSSGKRCVLETNVKSDGGVDLECQTSKVVAEKFSSWIETDQCIDFCGLSRMYVGLSSDFLGEKDIQRSICASECIEGCPNIAELFTRLASGEGVGLKSHCEAHYGAPVVVAATEESNSSTEEDSTTETTNTTEEEPTKTPSISRKLIQSFIPASVSVTVTTPQKVTVSVFPAADAPSASVYSQAAYFVQAPAAAPSASPVVPASAPVVVDAPIQSVSPAPATETFVVPAPASEAVGVSAPASESPRVAAPAAHVASAPSSEYLF